jgi:hypothetical protein
MRIWKEKILVKAPVAHVFNHATNFDYFEKYIMSNKNEIREELKDRGIKKLRFTYNQKLDELAVISEKPLFKIIRDKTVPNEYSSGILVPLCEPVTLLGEAKLESWFTEINGETEVVIEINSLKIPNVFWRIAMKIYASILKFQSKSDMKRYVKFIEKSA